MEITKEIQEMLERSMADYYALYWKSKATEEQEKKRIDAGKTFEGAYKYCRSIAEKMQKDRECVAIADDVAYWVLMEYMESADIKEGDVYRTAEEIKEEEERKAKEEARKAEEVEKKRKEMGSGSMLAVSKKEAESALEEERKAREEKWKAKRVVVNTAKKRDQKVAELFKQMELFNV